LAASVLLAGCAGGGRVGGREFPLLIDSDPGTHRTAYVVPNTAWVRQAKSHDPLYDDSFLAPYKVTSGKTPTTVYAPSKQVMVVVTDGQRRARSEKPVVPGTDASVTVSLD
jgi:hypothetical protein